MNRTVEIRTYTIKQGARAEFLRLMATESLPMLRRWKVDVVRAGPSLHDQDSCFLIRAYASVDERQKSQDDFYGSKEWREGPREAIVGLIESTISVVLELDEAAIQTLRESL